MISERKFAKRYISFWNRTCPLSRSFVRKANLMSKRYSVPLISDIKSDRRSLVSETAYRLFLSLLEPDIMERKKTTRREDERLFAAALEGTIQFLKPFYAQNEITASEKNEVLSLCDRLLDFFIGFFEETSYVANPTFPGCGIIGTCYADLMVENTIFEIKTTNDNFIAPDFRQVIVYLALNHISNLYEFEKVFLVNPLRGVYFDIDVEDMVVSISGDNPLILYYEIERYVTAESELQHLKKF